MQKSTDHMTVMDFLRAVYLCRELPVGIERYCASSVVDEINAALNIDGHQMMLNRDHGVHATNEMAQVATLVLGDLDRTEFSIETNATPAGQQALAALRQLVYRNGSDQLALARCVFQGTVDQAHASKELCIAALIDSVAPDNCLSLMALAESCGCPELLERCQECALRNFNTAIEENVDGLGMISQQQLVQLLTHDDLLISSELDVYSALSFWIEHDLAERQSVFAPLFARTLRFSQLTHNDLVFLVEEAQLVALDQKAMELAALSLIQRYMGVPHDDVLGQGPGNAPRKCQIKNSQSVQGEDVLVEVVEASLRTSLLRPLLQMDASISHGPTRAGEPKSAVKKVISGNGAPVEDKENVPNQLEQQHVCPAGLAGRQAEMFLSPSRPQAAVALVKEDSCKCSPSAEGSTAQVARRVLQW